MHQKTSICTSPRNPGVPVVVDRPWEGNAPKHLDAVHFIALPEYVRALSFAQIDTVK